MTSSCVGGTGGPSDDAVAAIIDRLDNTAVVVTTAAVGRVSGCLATYVTGASISPRRLLVLTSPENLTHEMIDRSGFLAVNIVGRSEADWVDHFGRVSGRDVDKFADVAWQPGVTGAPLLTDAIGHLEGRVIASFDCGDHTARLVEAVSARVLRPGAAPLTTLEMFATGLEVPSGGAPAPWPPT